MLNREQCENALQFLKENAMELVDDEDMEGNMVYDYYNFSEEDLREYVEPLEKLIAEHFDNPPLTFEELTQMKNKPVWNNKDKKWYLIPDCYKPFVLNQWVKENAIAIRMIDQNGNTRLIGINCDGVINVEKFEENCFYRKQVEE